MLKNSNSQSTVHSHRSKKQRTMHFFCNSCRYNISPPLSSPMLDFNIDLYEDKSKDRAICPHSYRAK